MLRAYKNKKHSKNLPIDQLFNLSTLTNSLIKKYYLKRLSWWIFIGRECFVNIISYFIKNIFNEESQSAEKILKQIRR